MMSDRSTPLARRAVGVFVWLLPVFVAQADAPPCHDCGSIMVRNGACYACANCGATSGVVNPSRDLHFQTAPTGELNYPGSTAISLFQGYLDGMGIVRRPTKFLAQVLE